MEDKSKRKMYCVQIPIATINGLKRLQRFYSEKYGFKVSQANVIEALVKADIARKRLDEED